MPRSNGGVHLRVIVEHDGQTEDAEEVAARLVSEMQHLTSIPSSVEVAGARRSPLMSAEMPLRDWFAGQALAGMLATDAYDETFEVAPRHAYRYAVAMLAERTKESA